MKEFHLLLKNPLLNLKGKNFHCAKEIRDFLSEHIAAYKVPRKIIFVEELPTTPTGKVLKKELRRWKKE